MLFFSVKSYSQIYEFALNLGINKSITDIGDERFFIPNSFSSGFTLKKNIGERYILRSSLNYHSLKGDDNRSLYSIKKNRNYSFKSNIIELSAGMDLTFKKYLFYQRKISTFYLIGEISIINYSYSNPNLKENGEIDYNIKNKFTFGVPLGFGYKYKINKFVFSIEYKVVPTISNNLDGRDISGLDFTQEYNISRNGKNDWYNYMTIGISYAFGREKCFFCLKDINKYIEKRNYKK